MRTIERVDDLEAWRDDARAAGERIALVPTMGALHEGHLSLIDLARGDGRKVVVSVFVNPTQFGPSEDFETYPRAPERDGALAEARGADIVFAPTVDEMYPVEQTMWIDPGSLGEGLCGRSRPGHFRGVLTVVAKLFAITHPHIAVFGRKDFQQSVLVRRMATELGFSVRILTASTVREPDGLALSSRNACLSPAEREAARALPEALRLVRRRFSEGERDPGRLEAVARGRVGEAGAAVDYVEIVEPVGLARPGVAGASHVCAVAARLGGTRLIDNATLGLASSLDGVDETAG